MNTEENMDLPRGCTPIHIPPINIPIPDGPVNQAPPIKPKSQFGNPIWGHDDNEASPEERKGRRDGMLEALRLVEGPSIMTNNVEFQTGLDAAIDVMRRRLAEL
jgi:hypothetical protein